MLRFFRQIRMKLIGEDRLRKYLLYAIGEIFLVVVGILIALQINNSNQQRQNRSFELKMLNEVRKDLNKDIEFGEMLLGRVSTAEAATQTLLQAYGTQNDALVLLYYPMMEMGISYTYRKGAYEALKSNGFDRISNDTIRSQLSGIYDFSHPRVAEFMEHIEQVNMQWEKQLEKELLELELREDTLGKRYIVYVPQQGDLLNDKRFLRLLDIWRGKAADRKLRLEDMLSQCNLFMEQLNRELVDYYPPVKSRIEKIQSVGFLGTATPGGWDSGLDMKDEDQDGIYTLETTLTDGEIKFRANDTWDINWGSVYFPIGPGGQDGANIPVQAGNYKITLNTRTGFYRFERLD